MGGRRSESSDSEAVLIDVNCGKRGFLEVPSSSSRRCIQTQSVTASSSDCSDGHNVAYMLGTLGKGGGIEAIGEVCVRQIAKMLKTNDSSYLPLNPLSILLVCHTNTCVLTVSCKSQNGQMFTPKKKVVSLAESCRPQDRDATWVQQDCNRIESKQSNSQGVTQRKKSKPNLSTNTRSRRWTICFSGCHFPSPPPPSENFVTFGGASPLISSLVWPCDTVRVVFGRVLYIISSTSMSQAVRTACA